MKRISLLLMNLFFFYSTILSQEQIKPNPEFYHTWLWADFYSELMNGKTPYQLYPLPIHTMQLYFDKDENEVLYGTFHEGITKKFKVLSRDSIEVLDAENKSKGLFVYLSKNRGQTNLILKNEGETFTYVALDDKYNLRHGVNYFINDKFFTGNYIAEEDSNIKITFTSDGRAMGINNFNEYTLPIEGVPLPRDFDVVLFFEMSKTIDRRIRNSTLMHWKKLNNKIILYNVSKSSDDPRNIGRYSEAKVLDKYLTLKKVD